MLLSVCWPTACSICWRRRPHDASLTTHDPLDPSAECAQLQLLKSALIYVSGGVFWQHCGQLVIKALGHVVAVYKLVKLK